MEKGLAEGFVCLFFKNHLREEKNQMKIIQKESLA